MEKTSDLVSKIQEFDFKLEYKNERNPVIKIKLLALHHLQSGMPLKDVANVILYDESAIRRWIRSFVDFDYEGLIERGSKPRLPCEQEEIFKIELDLLHEEKNGGRITVDDIQLLLLNKFDCNYSRSGIYTLLDRINIVWISGRSKHPKSSQEAMELFKETFPNEVNTIKAEIESNKIEFWWQDESRVGQQGSLIQVWAAKGTRSRVVRQKQFLSTYIFGACCPEKDKGCALILPLPSYSPELNPMEQVWQKLKHGSLSNRVFKNYDEIVKSCVVAWNSFCDEEGNIKSLCSRAWAQI